MWCFTWMLGLGFACLGAIVNALWLEARGGLDDGEDEAAGGGG